MLRYFKLGESDYKQI